MQYSHCGGMKLGFPASVSPVRQSHRPARASLRVSSILAIGPTLYKYTHRTNRGRLVEVVVEDQEQAVLVDVTAEAIPVDSPDGPIMHWGVYRASNKSWVFPEDMMPLGSSKDPGLGAVCTPMASGPDQWQARFQVPKKLVPLHLAISLYNPGTNQMEGPRTKGANFVIPVGMTPGKASPLGPSVAEVLPPQDGQEARYNINFAVFSRNATAITLCLSRISLSEDETSTATAQGPLLEVTLDPASHRTGDIWHITLHGLRDPSRLAYAWRAEGDITWADGSRFHSAYLLLDPYATLAIPTTLAPSAPQYGARTPAPGLDANTHLLSSLAPLLTEWSKFDWSNTRRPQISLEDTVLYEITVDGFTRGPGAEEVAEENRGKFLGIADRIEHLKAVGVTSLVLEPVHLTAADVTGVGMGKPLSLFAMNTKFAVGSPMEASWQLKETVRRLHSEGLEVLIQVEFCLTAEGTDEDNYLFSLRGLDAGVYYRGAGQCILNTGHPVVSQLVKDALRHWAMEYQLDGFVLLNAENLVMDRGGTILDAPPLVEDIALDPFLKGLKIIASSGNDGLLPRGGERGFPHWGLLLEWTNRTRTEVWSHMKDCTPGLLSALATRITGSSDLCAAKWGEGLPGSLATGRRPAFAVNSLLPPGNLSVQQALLNDNVSDSIEVLSRSMLFMTLMAQGTPLVSEATASPKGFALFLALSLQLRRKFRFLLAPPTFKSSRNIRWHGISGDYEPDWSGVGGYGANYLAYSISSPMEPLQMIYLGFNPYSEHTEVTLPPPPIGTLWRRRMDTAMSPAETVSPESALLLESTNCYSVPPKAAVFFDVVEGILGAGGGAMGAVRAPALAPVGSFTNQPPPPSASPYPYPPIPGAPPPPGATPYASYYREVR